MTLTQQVPSDTALKARPSRVRGPQLRTDAAVVLAVFLAFTTCAVLSWESFGSEGGASFFYPATGITVAAMILNRRALWPGIAGAVVVAEILVDMLYGSTFGVSAAFAAANVVEPLIGASLVLAWCGGRPDLRKRRDFAVFVIAACAIAPAFGALIGGTVSSVSSGVSLRNAVVTWWAGDGLGVLVMASPILLWRLQKHILRKRPWEMAAVLLATGLLSVATFWTDFPPSILILPVLAWAAFRLDMLGAALGGAVAAFLGNFVATHGRGLYIDVHLSPAGRVAVTQIYVAVIVVVAMLIAQEASARLKAVRGREAERRERIRLETLSELALSLSAALTPEDIGRALQHHVLNEAGAQELYLGLLSQDGGRLEWVTTSGYMPPLIDEDGGIELSRRTVATDAVRVGKPVEMLTAVQYAEYYPEASEWPRRAGAESIVGWPMKSGGRPFGALVLVWFEQQSLNRAQRSYISAVATMASQALVRAKVYADEHARAAVLHSVAQPVAQVDVVGLEYRAFYQPAEADYGLGGDWYSVMALPDSRTFLAVGDVIGHGLLAVEDMAQLRITGNAYAQQGLSPAPILADLNRYAANQIRGEFATNLVAIFDPRDSSLTYSSAGHLPALLRRADTGDVVRLSEGRGPILGPFDDSVYVECTVPVRPGDVLVMYTDGLVEHHDEGLTEGIAHLEQVITAWPPAALLDCEALARDVAPAPRSDDICLVVVRFGSHDEH